MRTREMGRRERHGSHERSIRHSARVRGVGLGAGALLLLGCGPELGPGVSSADAVTGPGGEGIRASAGPHVSALTTVSTTGFPVTDLGPLGGFLGSASAINDRGDVVGARQTPSGVVAFLWTSKDGFQDLGTLGGASSRAHDINNRRQVVGSSLTASGETHAFLWTPNDGMVDLGTVGGPFSAAHAVNDRGQIAGATGGTSVFAQRAFLWDRGTMTTLELPPTADGARGFDVNNRGQVAGDCFSDGALPCSNSTAVLWDRDGFHALFGPSVAVEGLAAGISNRTVLVGGYFPFFQAAIRAFVWEDGVLTDLGSLGGDETSATAAAISGGRLEVVGWGDAPGSFQHAFLWTEGRGMIDLGTLGGVVSRAAGINRQGQVVGTAETSGGELRAVIWHVR